MKIPQRSAFPCFDPPTYNTPRFFKAFHFGFILRQAQRNEGILFLKHTFPVQLYTSCVFEAKARDFSDLCFSRDIIFLPLSLCLPRGVFAMMDSIVDKLLYLLMSSECGCCTNKRHTMLSVNTFLHGRDFS